MTQYRNSKWLNLTAAAALLLEKEKISREEFEALFEKEEAVPAV